MSNSDTRHRSLIPFGNNVSKGEKALLGALIGAIIPALLVGSLGLLDLLLLLLASIGLGAAFGARAYRKSAWLLSSVFAAFAMGYRGYHVGTQINKTMSDPIMPIAEVVAVPIAFVATLVVCLLLGLLIWAVASVIRRGKRQQGGSDRESVAQPVEPRRSDTEDSTSRLGPGQRWQVGLRLALLAIMLVGVSFGALGWRLYEGVRQRRILDEFKRLGGHPLGYDPRAPRWRASFLGGLFEVNPGEPLGNVTGLSGGSFATDAMLANAGELPNLIVLHLYRTKVTDRGLASLQNQQALRYIDLRGTQVTDAGLHHLAGLTNLRILNLPAAVSDGAIEELRKRLPRTNVSASRPRAWAFQSNEFEVRPRPLPPGPPRPTRSVKGDWYVAWTDPREVTHYANCGHGEAGRKLAEARARQVQSELQAGKEVTLRETNE